jgi:GNAT superfamily N-acetyltransferase
MANQVVAGYAPSADVWLAIEKRQTSDNCTGWDVVPQLRPNRVRDHKINVLAQFARTPMEGLEHVPLFFDLPMPSGLRTAMAFRTLPDGVVRPYAAPPEVPKDRVEMLRTAFVQTIKDPDFIGFVRQHRLTLDCVGPDKLLRRTVIVAPDVQGRGLGKQLMAEVGRAAREANMVLLKVPASVTAERFYSGLGFTGQLALSFAVESEAEMVSWVQSGRRPTWRQLREGE